MFQRTILVIVVSLVMSVPCSAQATKTSASATHEGTSGPLAWVSSDLNPRTVFWIQGRFVPVDDPAYRGGAEVATVLCIVREYECLLMDSTNDFANEETVWTTEFKAATWDKDAIMAQGRSVNGCTDETLKIRFSPPSVVIVNSPVLPMSRGCKGMNSAMDNLEGTKGATLKDQMEQDMLVPTRGPFPFEDLDSNAKKREKP